MGIEDMIIDLKKLPCDAEFDVEGSASVEVEDCEDLSDAVIEGAISIASINAIKAAKAVAKIFCVAGCDNFDAVQPFPRFTFIPSCEGNVLTVRIQGRFKCHRS